MLELALIENIQRQDLNPLEEALAFKQLQDEFGLKQDDIAKKVGLSRVAVTNKIRLLGLPEQVKEAVLNLLISEGHARALLGLKDPQSILAATNIVIKRSLSVRETEQLIRRINYAKEDTPKKPSELEKEIKEWEGRIAKRLGFTSKIKNLTTGGKIIIRYTDENELRELVSRLTR
jgi:ParB family chromosome partitioning protein